MFKMFEVKNQEVKMNHVQINQEKNVAEIATYMKFEISGNTSLLDQFEADYKGMFFQRVADEDEDIADKGEEEPKVHSYSLAHPEITNSQSINIGDQSDFRLIVEGFSSSDSVDNNVYVIGCIIDNAKLTFEDHGIVKLEFRVRCYCGDEDRGKLTGMLGSKQVITLEDQRVVQMPLTHSTSNVTAMAGMGAKK